MQYVIWQHARRSDPVTVRDGAVVGGLAAIIDGIEWDQNQSLAVVSAVDGHTRIAEFEAPDGQDRKAYAKRLRKAMRKADRQEAKLRQKFETQFRMEAKATAAGFAWEITKVATDYDHYQAGLVGTAVISTASTPDYPEDAHHWSQLTLYAERAANFTARQKQYRHAFNFNSLAAFMRFMLDSEFVMTEKGWAIKSAGKKKGKKP